MISTQAAPSAVPMPGLSPAAPVTPSASTFLKAVFTPPPQTTPSPDAQQPFAPETSPPLSARPASSPAAMRYRSDALMAVTALAVKKRDAAEALRQASLVREALDTSSKCLAAAQVHNQTVREALATANHIVVAIEGRSDDEVGGSAKERDEERRLRERLADLEEECRRAAAERNRRCVPVTPTSPSAPASPSSGSIRVEEAGNAASPVASGPPRTPRTGRERQTEHAFRTTPPSEQAERYRTANLDT